MRGKICIVGTGNLASNPRVLKEAAALHEAGYAVTTIACDYTDALRAYDDEIERTAPWQVVRVPRPAGERALGIAARALGGFIDAFGFDVPIAVAAAAYGGPVSTLRSAALRHPADLYIAHYIGALPAAAAAARRHGAALGFDAEDYHSGEGTGGAAEEFRMEMVQRIEETLLPRCRHLTASSPPISRAYAAQYGVSPRTLLNVFPLTMAPVSSGDPSRRPGQGLRAYWFSQTIGLDRGLQSFMQAMAKTETRVTLDIRGSNRWGHGDTLLGLARDLGVGDRVTLLPMAPPAEMVSLAAAYDVGLSLETEVTRSRKLCLTNKIFTYLLAGIPAMMSDTPAQRELSLQLGLAGTLVSLDDPQGIAAALDRLAARPALAEAKETAGRLGRERFNWDYEKRFLLESVAAVFAADGATGNRTKM